MSFRATYRRRTFIQKGRIRHTNPVPGLHLETSLRNDGCAAVVGVDEVGVGAWAGPVVVGAVILDPDRRIYKLRDSKLLDPPRRKWLADRVRERALAWSTGMSWPDEIDREGLSEGIRRAARRALAGLPITPDAILLDGKWKFVEHENIVALVRGDCESLSIAAASIVAKVGRDSLMSELASMYPVYRFDSNKGYPSPEHKWALAAFGPSPIHRRLFAPVRRLFEEGPPGRLLSAGGTIS